MNNLHHVFKITRIKEKKRQSTYQCNLIQQSCKILNPLHSVIAFDERVQKVYLSSEKVPVDLTYSRFFATRLSF